MKLNIRVIFLGRNLRKVVDILYNKYLDEPTLDDDHLLNSIKSNRSSSLLKSPKTGTKKVNRKFLVLDFSPSIVIDGSIDFVSVEMPDCKEMLNNNINYCAYTYMPVVKHYNLYQLKDVETLTEGFTFKEYDYRDLVHRFEQKVNLINYPKSVAEEETLLNNLACDYVKENPGQFDNVTAQERPKPKYQIGLLLPTQSTGSPSSSSSSIYGNIEHATRAAIASVNANANVLNHIQLDLNIKLISCAPEPLMKAYLGYHNDDKETPIIGILGPPCTHGLESVSTFSEVIGMTTIGYGPSVTAFEPRDGNQNFFRTAGESRMFAAALISVLGVLNWQRIATLSEEGVASSYLSPHFDSHLKEHNVEVLLHHKVPIMTDPRADHSIRVIIERLSDLKQRRAKIILLEIYDLPTALQVMCKAKHLNMTAADGFVWIIPSWIGDFKSPPENMSSCSLVELSAAFELQFSFDFLSMNENNMRLSHLNNNTINQWLEGYTKSLTDTGKTISKYDGYIFDAVWTYAFALDKLFRTGNLKLKKSIHDIQKHSQFLRTLKATNFTGVSGQINFDDRQSCRPKIIFGQWRALKFHRVDVTASPSNASININEAKIIWFNGRRPTDGRAVCSLQPLADFLSLDCDSTIQVLTVLLSILAAILASLAFYLYVRRFYNQKMKISAQVMRNLGIDLLNTTHAPENLLHDWEMPKDQIMLNRKLGEGAFGTVYGGQAYIDGSEDLQAVAVKTLKIGSTAEDRLDFLSEAEAMKRFTHPNILKLLGVCLQSEPIFSVIEFMLYGDLKTYLLARRHLVKDKIPDDSDVSPKRLTSMTMDILRGLAYLAEQKYVHRDIACRNCLVNADRRVKIGDFGMARPTGSNDYYRFSRKGLLPVRWLSPESLGSGFFTPASDIWSFGVLLFEIVSFGAFPYQGMSNNEVLEYVKTGRSMEVPEGVKPPLERLMRNCWTADYKKRPTAVQILEFVANNPRLVSPCVDIPHFSIQFSDNESDDVDFMHPANQSPDSGIGLPATRETMQDLDRDAAVRSNGHSTRGFTKAVTNGSGGGGGVPNGNGSLTYNPVEPLLLRQNSNELSSSSSSLFFRYVPMCGFRSGHTKKAESNGTAMMTGNNNNYANYLPANGHNGSLEDSEYTRMTITEF